MIVALSIILFLLSTMMVIYGLIAFGTMIYVAIQMIESDDIKFKEKNMLIKVEVEE